MDFDPKVAFLDSPRAAEFGKPIGILHGNREEAAGEFSFYRPFQGLILLYFDSPDHADDDGALGLLIRPVEVEISAIFIFCFFVCWRFGFGWRQRFDGLLNHHCLQMTSYCANLWLLIYSYPFFVFWGERRPS